MNLYFAPLEGITTYVYRRTHAEMFCGCDVYYAPFINPSEQEKISKKGIKDILPENNEGVPLMPQILTNNSESFLKFADKIKPLGYDELNINIGCPASTVVKKGRGAGFLRNPELIDKFLHGIFEHADIRISVKTRTGYASGDEMDGLMEIYNKYPMSRLIIHPRTRADLYKGMPDNEVFKRAYNCIKNSLCYNGNVYSADDYNRITAEFPEIEGVMFGRGAIKNPALFREIKGGAILTTAELVDFSDKLSENYYNVLQSDTFTLHKMKEVWVYMIQNYPDEKKIAKAIKKATTLSDLKTAIRRLPEL